MNKKPNPLTKVVKSILMVIATIVALPLVIQLTAQVIIASRNKLHKLRHTGAPIREQAEVD